MTQRIRSGPFSPYPLKPADPLAPATLLQELLDEYQAQGIAPKQCQELQKLARQHENATPQMKQRAHELATQIKSQLPLEGPNLLAAAQKLLPTSR